MKDFKKYYIINATPEEIYIALTNPFTISLWTSEPAIMSTEPGTEFSMLSGNIVGKNLEVITNKKIVQQWYFGEEEAVPSVVTIKLHDHKEGTSVELNHTNIPDEAYDDIIAGWDEVYFGNLNEYF